MVTVTYTDLSAGIAALITEKARQHISDGAQKIYDQSQSEVPIDDRELIDHAAIVVEASRQGVEASVGYGTDAISAEYAVIQHEDLTLNHPNGGKAKYLEDPFNRAIQELLQFKI